MTQVGEPALSESSHSQRLVAERRYAMRKVIARAQLGFALVFALAWILLIAEHAAFAFMAIGAVATLACVWQGIDVVRNAGVTETAAGISSRRVFGYRHWRWDEIHEFTSVRSRVYLVTQDRQVCPLAGINEGCRNFWDDGETRQITALLNERLAARRGRSA